MVTGIVVWLEKYVTCDFNFLKTLKRFRENLNDACAIFSVNKIMNGIHSYPDQICLQRASFELRNAYLHAHCTTIFNWSAKVHVESCNYYWRCFSCAVLWRQLNFQGERQCLPLHIDGSPQYTLPLPPPTAAQKGEKYSSYKTSTFFLYLVPPPPPPPCCLTKKPQKGGKYSSFTTFLLLPVFKNTRAANIDAGDEVEVHDFDGSFDLSKGPIKLIWDFFPRALTKKTQFLE